MYRLFKHIAFLEDIMGFVCLREKNKTTPIQFGLENKLVRFSRRILI